MIYFILFLYFSRVPIVCFSSTPTGFKQIPLAWCEIVDYEHMDEFKFKERHLHIKNINFCIGEDNFDSHPNAMKAGELDLKEITRCLKMVKLVNFPISKVPYECSTLNDWVQGIKNVNNKHMSSHCLNICLTIILILLVICLDIIILLLTICLVIFLYL
jgi:hypothetical protein